MKNKLLAELWQRRGMNIGLLADQIFSARPSLTQVLCGVRAGGQTWPKLKRILSEEEYVVAKDFAEMRRGEARVTLMAFQQAHELPRTGQLDEETLARLRGKAREPA